MIVESKQTIVDIFELSQKHTEIFVLPIYSDLYIHPCLNSLSLLYIASKDKDFILPVNHPDSDINFTKLQLDGILSKFSYIYVNDKKEFLHTFKWKYQKSKKVLDLNLSAWFTTNQSIDTNEISTSAHDFIERRYTNFPRVNSVIPIYKHLEKCRSIKDITYKHYITDNIIEAKAYQNYNEIMLYNLYLIE